MSVLAPQAIGTMKDGLAVTSLSINSRHRWRPQEDCEKGGHNQRRPDTRDARGPAKPVEGLACEARERKKAVSPCSFAS